MATTPIEMKLYSIKRPVTSTIPGLKTVKQCYQLLEELKPREL